jgi:hypothetical protein
MIKKLIDNDTAYYVQIISSVVGIYSLFKLTEETTSLLKLRLWTFLLYVSFYIAMYVMYIQFLNSSAPKKTNNILRKINDISFIITIIVFTILIYIQYSKNVDEIIKNKIQNKEDI